MNKNSIFSVISSIFLVFFVSTSAFPSTSILFLGDTHFGENYQEGKSPNYLEDEGYGYQYTIANFSDMLHSSDYVIANLETPITDMETSPFESSKGYVHYADPVLTPYHLLNNNINVFSLANNHTLDFGTGGLDDTFAAAAANGLILFGAGDNKSEAAEPHIHQFQIGTKTITIGVIGAFEYRSSYDNDYNWYAETDNAGAYALDASEVAAQVIELRNTYPDIFIIAYPHWGKNYAWKSSEQTEMAHNLIDYGVDMIIGHGAHRIQEVELYRNRWIVYSLGNFVFNSKGRYADKDPYLPYSMLLEMLLDDSEGNISIDFRLYPFFCDNRVTDFQNRFVTSSEFNTVENALLDQGGAGNWGNEYISSQDAEGRYFFEFQVTDGSYETEFMFDDFSDGTTGSYTLGSDTDADLKIDHKHCWEDNCIRLQDDSGIKSAFYSDSFDASRQDRIVVNFWMKSRYGESGDEYYVKYYDGSEWLTIETFTYGVDFVHNDILMETVVIDGSVYTMSANAKIMFEAAGKDNTDDLYFDCIRVAGFAGEEVEPPPPPLPEGTVFYDSFEDGTLGNWNDGGSKVQLVHNPTLSYDGNYSIEACNDYAYPNSHLWSDAFDASANGKITIDYYMTSSGVESADDYMVQYYDGSTWQTIETFVKGTDYPNTGQFYHVTLEIPDTSYNLAADSRIMIISSGDGNTDKLYFDNILITAT